MKAIAVRTCFKQAHFCRQSASHSTSEQYYFLQNETPSTLYVGIRYVVRAIWWSKRGILFDLLILTVTLRWIRQNKRDATLTIGYEPEWWRRGGRLQSEREFHYHNYCCSLGALTDVATTRPGEHLQDWLHRIGCSYGAVHAPFVSDRVPPKAACVCYPSKTRAISHTNSCTRCTALMLHFMAMRNPRMHSGVFQF